MNFSGLKGVIRIVLQIHLCNLPEQVFLVQTKLEGEVCNETVLYKSHPRQFLCRLGLHSSE